MIMIRVSSREFPGREFPGNLGFLSFPFPGKLIRDPGKEINHEILAFTDHWLCRFPYFAWLRDFFLQLGLFLKSAKITWRQHKSKGLFKTSSSTWVEDEWLCVIWMCDVLLFLRWKRMQHNTTLLYLTVCFGVNDNVKVLLIHAQPYCSNNAIEIMKNFKPLCVKHLDCFSFSGFNLPSLFSH